MSTTNPASTSGASNGGGGMPTTISGNPIWSAIRAYNPSAAFGKHRTQILLVGGVSICIIGIGIGGYYLWRNKAKRSFEQAERRKAVGIEAFKQKQYEEAIRLFTEATQLLNEQKAESEKWRELAASCQNNIAACYDALGDPEKCIDHCTAAIRHKPTYTKALMRRARCLHQVGRNAEALEEYFDLVTMERGSEGALQPQQYELVQNEMDKIAEAMSTPHYLELVEKRAGQPLKIAQSMVAPWQYSLAVNDPLLARTATLTTNATDSAAADQAGLDGALIALKRGNYDDVASLASAVANNEQIEPLERAQGVLLAARFLYYQALDGDAKTMADQFGGLWEKLDEAQKLANKDLHVAHIVLQMMLNQSLGRQLMAVSIGGDGEDTLNETAKQRLAHMAEEALRVNPKNVDALLFMGRILMSGRLWDEALITFQRVKKLDREHPYVRYYDIFAAFQLALQHQNIYRTQNHIIEMERAIKEANNPPVFALLMMAQIGLLMQNHEIMMEYLKRVLQQMPNNSYVIYLISLTEPNYEQKKRAIGKAIEADPNNWEPYRQLAIMAMNEHNFAEADRLFSECLDLARGKDELMVVLKDRLMTGVIEERRRNGRRLPSGIPTL